LCHCDEYFHFFISFPSYLHLLDPLRSWQFPRLEHKRAHPLGVGKFRASHNFLFCHGVPVHFLHIWNEIKRGWKRDDEREVHTRNAVNRATVSTPSTLRPPPPPPHHVLADAAVETILGTYIAKLDDAPCIYLGPKVCRCWAQKGKRKERREGRM